VAIVAGDAGRLLWARAPLIRTLVGSGHKVMCLAARADGDERAALAALGAQTGEFELAPERPRLFGGRQPTAALVSLLAEWRPNVVMGIGFAPMLAAAAAARAAAVPRVVLIASSLGGLDGARNARVGIGMRWHLRRALRAAHVVVVHNADHERRLRELEVVPNGLNVRILPGAGVDLAHYSAQPLPPLHPGLVFLMIARRERSRGIAEFCEAARLVKSKAPNARFVLATSDAVGEGSLEAAELQTLAGAVELVTMPADPRELIGSCHVFVYPSHGEGMAHEVLQALACGRSVVTTTAAGCRDTVDERVSGVLVPPGDGGALAAAMESHLRRPDLIAWMSQAARTKAERRFDANAAAAGVIALLGLEA
jgi:glycosyltransferase involved in cell wall biosynthesis